MYQWLTHYIHCTPHIASYSTQTVLTAKNRNHVIVLDSKIAQWRLSVHPTFHFIAFAANDGRLATP